jgi:hypothetical protein
MTFYFVSWLIKFIHFKFQINFGNEDDIFNFLHLNLRTKELQKLEKVTPNLGLSRLVRTALTISLLFTLLKQNLSFESKI